MLCHDKLELLFFANNGTMRHGRNIHIKQKVAAMKKILIGALSLLQLILILLFPETALQGARDGLLLWFNRVIPALLPCMILSQLCLHSQILEKLTKAENNSGGRISGLTGYGWYIALTGLLCGIPMGARMVHDAFCSHKIKRREAMLLLTCSNQLSPAFLIEYVFADPGISGKMRSLLLISYYMSVLAMWIMSRYIFIVHPEKKAASQSDHTVCAACCTSKKEVSQTFSLSENLDTSIMNSLETILRIGGYILLFSVLAAIVQVIAPFPQTVKGILVSVFEITTGMGQIKVCYMAPAVKCILINSLCAFGGLSSLMQVCGMLNDTGLPVRICIMAKLGQGALTALITGLLFFFVL